MVSILDSQAPRRHVLCYKNTHASTSRNPVEQVRQVAIQVPGRHCRNRRKANPPLITLQLFDLPFKQKAQRAQIERAHSQQRPVAGTGTAGKPRGPDRLQQQ